MHSLEREYTVMDDITIKWLRLVDGSGATCDRCGSTESALDAAYEKLRSGLMKIGLNTRLEKYAIDEEAFTRNPLLSNQITIEGRTIEQWLNATTGHNQCCGPCGDNDCRTIEVDGLVYEDIPEVLIIRACLLAAADKLGGGSLRKSCC